MPVTRVERDVLERLRQTRKSIALWSINPKVDLSKWGRAGCWLCRSVVLLPLPKGWICEVDPGFWAMCPDCQIEWDRCAARLAQRERSPPAAPELIPTYTWGDELCAIKA